MNIYLSTLSVYLFFTFVTGYIDPSVTNPQLVKKFEYKLSFRGPNLAFKDGTVPFWSFGGNAIASEEQVRITPSIRSQKGWIWSKNTLTADNWQLDVKLKITGRGRVGADGMAIWFTEAPGTEGTVFGSNDHWKGLGIFLDSFDNDALQNNPIITVTVNDGTKSYDHQHDGSTQMQGSCIKDFRNKPFPIRLKIEYIDQGLTIYINNGISMDDNAFEFCTHIDRIQLPKIGYLGVTAATGGLADDHDVLEFLTYSYSDRQTSKENQAGTDEQTKKYKEEYEQYERELQQQQEAFRKDHPDATTRINEQQMFESEYDREFRVILEGQDQIRVSLSSIDRKMVELLGRIERLSSINVAQTQDTMNTNVNIPTDVARVQDINRVINANTDMTRTIQSFGQVLSDLQQKLNNLQMNANNQQLTGSEQRTDSSNIPSKTITEIRDTVLQIKSETNTIAQKTSNQITCSSKSTNENISCLGSYFFIIIIVIQTVLIIGFFTFKNREDRFSRKYV